MKHMLFEPTQFFPSYETTAGTIAATNWVMESCYRAIVLLTLALQLYQT